jgi:hypothetical protein
MFVAGAGGCHKPIDVEAWEESEPIDVDNEEEQERVGSSAVAVNVSSSDTQELVGALVKGTVGNVTRDPSPSPFECCICRDTLFRPVV